MGNAAPMKSSLPELKPNEALTSQTNLPSYAMNAGKNVASSSATEAKELTPQAPKENDLPPPSCLTDGSNTAIPRDYIVKWKIHNGNIKQRMKELRYTLNFLHKAGMPELVKNAKTYERDFYLLCKGMYQLQNPEEANRKAVLELLVKEGVLPFLKDYWKAMMGEFEAKRAEKGEKLTNGQLWEDYATTEPHIVDALSNCYWILIIVWNGSDMKNTKLLTIMYDSIAEFVLQCLDKHLYPLEAKATHPQHKTVKACLGIIHNFCNKHDNAISDLREKDGLRIIDQYRKSGTLTLKTKSILAYSYLLSEDDIKNKSEIEMEEKDIAFLVKVLRDALDSPKEHSKQYGYHAEELIVGFNNIAVADSNKKRLVDAGVLPLYVEAMNRTKLILQECAAKGVWTLAFDDKSMKLIKEEPGLVDALRKLAKSPNAEVKAAADGALWKLEGETKHLQMINAKQAMPAKSDSKKLQHIMISYQWDVQGEVRKIRERLRKAGFRVWIDFEQMSGNTAEAMAKAVENAAIIVPVLTEKYKASVACRQEMSYANQIQKKLVPVRMQAKYRPDGWLAFILGGLYYDDFSSEQKYESEFGKFLEKLPEEAKIKPGESPNPVCHEEEAMNETAIVPTTVAPMQMLTGGGDSSDVLSGGKTIFNVTRLKCVAWTPDQVTDWLKQNQLEKHTKKFAGYNGRLLAELASLQFISPDAYYSIMKQEHSMPLIDILKLNAALRELNPL